MKKKAETADFFSAYIDEGRKRYGDDRVLVGSDDCSSVQFGFELPSFAEQYLYSANIFPMSKIVGFAGSPASFKSAQLFDKMRLFVINGGYAHLVETENKWNPQYLKSVVDCDFRGEGTPPSARVRIDQVQTLEEAQDSITAGLSFYEKKCPDKSIPFLIGVDSLVGTKTENMDKDIDKAGHASKAFPEQALIWSTYLKKLSSDLIGLPINIVFVNHLKDKIDTKPAFGPVPKTKGGGVAQDFFASHWNYMTRVADIDRSGKEGCLVELKSYKCCLGPSRRRVVVPVYWTYEEDPANPGQPLQRTWFDWHAASARLFDKNGDLEKTSDLCDIRCVSGNEYSSDELGLSRADPTTLGKALFDNKEYLSKLRIKLGISKWRTWE